MASQKSPREILAANLARAKRRHPGRASTMISGRQYATSVDGTTITFVCKRQGHTYVIDFGSKRRALTKRLGPTACQQMARWWSKERGGCIGECPKCEAPS